MRLNKLPSSVAMNIREIRVCVEATDGMIDMFIFLTPSLKATLLQIYSELSDCFFILPYIPHKKKTFPTTTAKLYMMEITNFSPNPLPSTMFTLPVHTVLPVPAITSSTNSGSRPFWGQLALEPRTNEINFFSLFFGF